MMGAMVLGVVAPIVGTTVEGRTTPFCMFDKGRTVQEGRGFELPLNFLRQHQTQAKLTSGGVESVNTQHDKHAARQRRERRFRRWLMTLSWTMPAVAFGGFWSVWHGVGVAEGPTSQAPLRNSPVGTQASQAAPQASQMPGSIEFTEGSQGPQVAAIQEQLRMLGYFEGPVTGHYGPVTTAAVRAFQESNGLNPTGSIDIETRTALNQAVKRLQRTRLASSSIIRSQSAGGVSHRDEKTTSSHRSGTDSTPSADQANGSVSVSQQPAPVTRSSASGR
jgi:hypothetical protein